MRLGQRKQANGVYHPLNAPDRKPLVVKKDSQESCMKRIGESLLEVVKEYVRLFPCPFLAVTFVLCAQRALFSPLTGIRIISSDELVSDKLDAVFKETGRDF